MKEPVLTTFEARATKLKRLKIRSWRRGIKEMDLILGAFADAGLAELSDANLALYDQMLSENDHDMYAWASGQSVTPPKYEMLIRLAVKAADMKSE